MVYRNCAYVFVDYWHLIGGIGLCADVVFVANLSKRYINPLTAEFYVTLYISNRDSDSGSQRVNLTSSNCSRPQCHADECSVSANSRQLVSRISRLSISFMVWKAVIIRAAIHHGFLCILSIIASRRNLRSAAAGPPRRVTDVHEVCGMELCSRRA